MRRISEAAIDPYRLGIQSAVCPRCGVQPGEQCVSASGRRTTLAHAKRTEPFFTAWRAGYWSRWNEEHR